MKENEKKFPEAAFQGTSEPCGQHRLTRSIAVRAVPRDQAAAAARVMRMPAAATTRSTSMPAMECMSVLRLFHSGRSEAGGSTTWCMVPYGPLRAAGTGPKSPTQGVPTAAARCKGPVSLEIHSRERRQSSPRSWRLVLGARIAAWPAAAAICSAAVRSSGPPQTMTDCNPCCRWIARATAANRSGGQTFDGQPAPGLSITGAARILSEAIHSCIRPRLVAQDGIVNDGDGSTTPMAASSWQLRSTTWEAVDRTACV